ncbi:MAG: UDP-glucose 4-epimerase GalE [Gordonibacter sp.]|uniref:UDP-glucose 4-epimerase GalE n=1 Tax=Gordonibacter sp. TaxID=1968902 RepID=UPI002FC83CF8
MGCTYKNILVTGGAGFIGSHTCVRLLEADYNVIVVDNLSNSSKIALDRIKLITGKAPVFYEVDILDKDALDAVFAAESIDAVIHFAGFKAVGESVEKPMEYYWNNCAGTLMLCEVMRKHNVKNIVFSSSATVYGDPAFLPITEECPKGAITNPYGQTKSMLEQVLADLQASDEDWRVMLLRYFNPIGAHPSGLIGEDPCGIPNNLIPYVAQTAAGRRDFVRVFGDDYDTVDGTGIRDYVHVVDLAEGHLKALERMATHPGIDIFNLGTGEGYSVLEVIHAFEKASGKSIPYKITARRKGDIATCYASSAKAEKLMGWKAQYGLDEMCCDSWRWQVSNPSGYNL